MNQFQRFTLPIKPIFENKEITILILGADVAQRKKSHGPKSLLALGTKWNIIEAQLDAIKTVFPKADIVLVTGFQSQAIVAKHYPVRIVENPFFEETSDVEQIRIGLNATLSDKVLIIGGDVAFDAPALMNIASHKTSILFDEVSKNDDDSVGITHNNNVLENMSYSIPNKWLHTLFIEGRELEMLKKFVRNKERSKLLFFEAVNYLVNNNALIRAIPQQNGAMYKVTSN